MTATVYNRPGEYAPPVDPPEELEALASDDQPRVGTLWDQRPVLGHIRDFALARMCSPAAVLGVVLLRALAVIPPAVALPPLIGGPGSLNLFVALVGPPGAGKGAAESAGAAAVHLGDVYTTTVGSGEGIAHQYAHRERGEVIVDRDSVLFSVPEVDALDAIGSRLGATLMSQLRSAFSGEALGYSYADQSRRLPIPRHSYRLGMIVGVQPEKAKALLDDADGGTPQRFIWLRATDPQISSTPPQAPEPVTIAPLNWGTVPYDIHSGLRILTVPDCVRTDILEAHAARARGEGHALDGHALFAREKVAQALAVLEERLTMTEDDWHLAGDIMRLSDHTRTATEAAITRAQTARRAAAIDYQVQIQLRADDSAHQRKVERVARLIAKRVGNAPDTQLPANRLRKSIDSGSRDVFEEALTLAVDQALVDVVEVDGGRIVKAVLG
ncbi:MAG: hypothetical protein QM804_04055 [Propionicimonas sp.]